MDDTPDEPKHESALQFLIRHRAEKLLLTSTLRALDPVLALLPGQSYEIDGDIGVGKTQVKLEFNGFFRSRSEKFLIL
uniref:Uncharacterized protein n=1 Tax=Caenorhabditis japonica TaxID=281687 RepID=A0A8R1J1Z9_CAEJA